MSEGIRPQPTDTRYDLRMRLMIAKAHARLGEAGVYDHVLAALAELAMGMTLNGEKLKNLHPRTQVQAAAAFFRVAGQVLPTQHEHAGPDGGPIEVHTTGPSTPEERQAWLEEVIAATHLTDATSPETNGEAVPERDGGTKPKGKRRRKKRARAAKRSGDGR